MPNKAKHAFGPSEKVDKIINDGLVNARDILFLDEDTEPKIAWVKKDGTVAYVKTGEDLTEVKSEISEVSEEVETKADASVVAASYERVKFEISDTPIGTLVNIGEREIRVMAPSSAAWKKQSVGAGGDANSYYMTLKTFAPEDATGYIEHLNGQTDASVLTDLKVDQYGRKYQPTWLAMAKYDEATDSWSYYGANSSEEKYIGWDYQIDWYNSEGIVIASDSVRINLSNEECHGSVKPSYVNSILAEVDTKVEEAVQAALEEQLGIVEF